MNASELRRIQAFRRLVARSTYRERPYIDHTDHADIVVMQRKLDSIMPGARLPTHVIQRLRHGYFLDFVQAMMLGRVGWVQENNMDIDDLHRDAIDAVIRAAGGIDDLLPLGSWEAEANTYETYHLWNPWVYLLKLAANHIVENNWDMPGVYERSPEAMLRRHMHRDWGNVDDDDDDVNVHDD